MKSHDLWDTKQRTNLWIIGVPGGGREERGQTAYFKNEKISNLQSLDIQIHMTQLTKKMNLKYKKLKTESQRENLKRNRKTNLQQHRKPPYSDQISQQRPHKLR